MSCILVVDDDAGIRGLMSRMLQKQHQVHTAEDGSVALEMLQFSDFDLVISDLQMPVMDGEALLTQIRVQGKQVPFLLMSGHVPEANSAARLWSDDFLAKPFLLGDLREKVDLLVAKHAVA